MNPIDAMPPAIQADDQMSHGEELLEPFQPRGSTDSLIRRGSVIVIQSLENSEECLLETFRPRNSQENERALSTELLEPFQERQEETATADFFGGLWNMATPAVWSTTKTQEPDAKEPRDAARPSLTRCHSFQVVPKSRSSQESTRWYQTLWSNTSEGYNEEERQRRERQERFHTEIKRTIQDDEGFRKLQKELREMRLVNGFEPAVERIISKHNITGSPMRTRRRSNSFSHPLWVKTECGAKNLSPFGDEP